MRAGYHPLLWRHSISACLRKLNPKDYSLPRSYCLIALLECLGKVLESVQARHLAHYAVTHGLVPETQFGGMPGRSVEDTGLTFVHNVETAARSHLATSAMTFDITGYFDHVSHPRLLAILHEANLPTPLVCWVVSFLTDRQTAICIDGKVGEMAPVRTGMPQGSPVSPILAALFSTLNTRVREAAPGIRARLNPRHNPSEGGLISYIDDGKLYVSSASLATNVKHLAALFDVARAWAADECLVLDDNKCDLMHYTCAVRKVGGRHVRIVPRPPPRVPDNNGSMQTIQPVATYRWLGIIWDSKLTFAAHVKCMAERGANVVAALSMLENTTSGLRPLHLRQIHIACILSILTFGSLLWFMGHRQATLLGHLNVVVRCCRHVLGAFKTTPLTSYTSRRRSQRWTSSFRSGASVAPFGLLGLTSATHCCSGWATSGRSACARPTRHPYLHAPWEGPALPPGSRASHNSTRPMASALSCSRWRRGMTPSWMNTGLVVSSSDRGCPGWTNHMSRKCGRCALMYRERG